jgi:hypothetical protein
MASRACRVVTPEWLAWACLGTLCVVGTAGTAALGVGMRTATRTSLNARAARIAGVVCAFVALVAGIHADAFFRGKLWSGECVPPYRAGMLAAETLTALFIIAWTVIAIVAAARA